MVSSTLGVKTKPVYQSNLKLKLKFLFKEDLEGNSNELFDRFLSRSGPGAPTHITLTSVHTVHHPPHGNNDEIELMMEAYPNGQESSFVQNQNAQRKISQNSSNSAHSTTTTATKEARPDSRSPEQNGDQEWVS